MKILPEATQPPAEPILRRYAPRAGDYTDYRDCIRWEFGFTCAFCLLHETDLMEHGLQGLGIITIEHPTRKGAVPAERNTYSNCVCAWARHFRWADHHLVPEPGDGDAQYTHEAYDFDDPVKVKLRHDRGNRIRGGLRAIAVLPGLLEDLHSKAQADLENAEKLLARAEAVEDTLRQAIGQLQRYRSVPVDAPATCRCRKAELLRLPDFLAGQCQEISLPEI